MLDSVVKEKAIKKKAGKCNQDVLGDLAGGVGPSHSCPRQQNNPGGRYAKYG